MFVHFNVCLGFFVAPEMTTSFESITLVSSFNTIPHRNTLTYLYMHLNASTYTHTFTLLYLNLMFVISSVFQEPFEMFPEGSGEVPGVGESEQENISLFSFRYCYTGTHLVIL